MNKNVRRFLPSLFELARSKELSQGQKTLLKKGIMNLYRGVITKKRKVITKEIDRISRILLELIN